MGRKIRTREGFLVDSETGEVVDESPLEFSDGVSWNVDACPDEEAVERIINSIVPGLVELLKLYLKRSLCGTSYSEIESVLSGIWGSDGAQIIGRILRKRLADEIDVHEARAYDLAGLAGLATYRCFRRIGREPQEIIKAIESVVQGYEGSSVTSSVYALIQEIRGCRGKTLVRWVSKPLRNQIDIAYASQTLGAEIKSIGKLQYITTKIHGLGVQITQNKVDVSSKASEVEKVVEVISYLSRRLGVELSKPIPLVATIVIKLPFKINIRALAYHEKGELQGSRAKIAREYYTLLAYPTTINIYAKLDGIIDKIESIVAEALPTVCTYIEQK
ncbi:MAG: hypothetical protein QW348_00285 [Ignisphaera sp.]